MTAADLKPWIAADLKQWRQRLGYSLTTAAQVLGVNRSTYCRMESGATRIDLRTELACRWREHERMCPYLAA